MCVTNRWHPCCSATSLVASVVRMSCRPWLAPKLLCRSYCCESQKDAASPVADAHVAHTFECAQRQQTHMTCFKMLGASPWRHMGNCYMPHAVCQPLAAHHPCQPLAAFARNLRPLRGCLRGCVCVCVCTGTRMCMPARMLRVCVCVCECRRASAWWV